MKVYLLVTGTIFALIALAHILRMIFEPSVIRDPVFLVLTMLTIAMSIWSSLLLRRGEKR